MKSLQTKQINANDKHLISNVSAFLYSLQTRSSLKPDLIMKSDQPLNLNYQPAINQFLMCENVVKPELQHSKQDWVKG